MVVLAGLLVGCSGPSAAAEDFCESYASTLSLMTDISREDGGDWSAEVAASLTTLGRIAPREVEGSVEVITRAVVSRVEAEDDEAFHEVIEFAEASATVDSYIQATCNWPPWPPSPAYRSSAIDTTYRELALSSGNGASR